MAQSTLFQMHMVHSHDNYAQTKQLKPTSVTSSKLLYSITLSQGQIAHKYRCTNSLHITTIMVVTMFCCHGSSSCDGGERVCGMQHKINNMYITHAEIITDYNEHSVSLLYLYQRSLMNKQTKTLTHEH